MTGKLESIPLDQILVQKHNVRINEIDQGIEDLAENIRANGLLQPLTTYYDSVKSKYVILAGQRRLNAHCYLDDNYPGKGFDKILCRVIEEPKSDAKKKSMSLAENITQLPMTNTDLIKAVTDLYNHYGDYEMVQQEFGLTKYMVDKYVRLARLPEKVKNAIREGEIHSNPKTAENMALKAVDGLQYVKNGSISEEKVIEFATELSKSDNPDDIIAEAIKGGTTDEIKARAEKKSGRKQKLDVDLDREYSEKLDKIAESNGESKKQRATQYVVDGIERDYGQLGD